MLWSVMSTNRRGVLAALLCSPLLSTAQRRANGTVVIELRPATADAPVLEVRYEGKVANFTAGEIMDALQPLAFPDARGPFPPIPAQN